MSIPRNFPAFRNINVVRVAEGVTTVRWILNPTDFPMDDVVFEVFRSNSPAGPWDILGVVEQGARFEYTDYNAPGDYVFRTFYYIVRIVSLSGKGYRDGEPALVQHDPDNIALDLVRKKNVFLTVKGGIALAVLIRKTWGAKCSRCWNQQRNAPNDPDCPNCLGTGYPGGYFNPVLIPGLFNPPKKVVINAGIPYKPYNVYIEVSNDPVLDSGDVVVDRRLNIRFKIEQISITTHRGYYVSQVALLNRLDSNSPVYRIPVPEPKNVPVGKSWELVRGVDAIPHS